MFFKQIKTPGLAHYSYIVGLDNRESFVIDPQRDIERYLEISQKNEMVITNIFETHRNEDFITGSLELAHHTGATIWHGPGLDFSFGKTLSDGQSFEFGNLKLVALHTIGHTYESMSFVLYDQSTGNDPLMIFTGDNLFIGSTGRVDFYGKEETPKMAAELYDSIHSKILPLGDGVILCPAHGAGSVCGGLISSRQLSTLGYEKLNNPDLQLSKEEFIHLKTSELHELVPYFKKSEELNLTGPPLLGFVPSPKPLSIPEFEALRNQDVFILDARRPHSFATAYIDGSINIWKDAISRLGGWFIPYDTPIVLILEEKSQLDEVVRMLIRMGHDQIIGYLRNSITGWITNGNPIEQLKTISIHSLKERLETDKDISLIDIRSEAEWNVGHIAEAIHIPTKEICSNYDQIPQDKELVIFCNSVNRSSTIASFLKKKGITSTNVLGGIVAWNAKKYPKV